MIGRLTFLAYVAGWRLVRALPERFAAALFRRGADLAYRRQGKGVRRLQSNLRRVLGPDASDDELARVTKAGVRSYARYWLEVFRLPVIPPERFLTDTTCIDEDRLKTAAKSGDGVIVALPHQGNWDAAGAWATLSGMPFTTVAERLEPEALFDRFVAFRESIGMEVVPLSGGEQNPFDLLAERLRAGGMLCLLGDRDLTERGIEVEFFGAATRFPAGPAALALRTGAALLPATLWTPERGWGIHIHEAVAVPETGSDADKIAAMTQDLARVFEAGIRLHPEDWHMLQRLWLSDLRPVAP